MKKTIYIITNGTVLRRVGRCLLLEKGQSKIFEIPDKEVGRILIYARTEVTAQTIAALLEKEVPLYYVRRSGRLRGKIMPATGIHVSFRRLQYQRFTDPDFGLPLARSIIRTKINNMQKVLEYLLRKQQGTAEVIRPLREASGQLDTCFSREEIMGVEGAATRHYFKFYGQHFPEPFQFKIRSRRPAQDFTNAILNLGYMILLREIETHLEAHNFDPYCGFLHALQDSRCSLALDLLEEFRQPLIDLFTLKTINLGRLKPEHFQSKEGGIQMTEEGFKKFFRLYEEQLGQSDGENPGLRKLIDDQARLLKQHLQEQSHYINFALDTPEEIIAQNETP